MPNRRHFLKSAAATAALAHPLSASIVRPLLQAAAQSGDTASVKSLDAWDHYRDSLAGPWEAWHGDEIATWESVTLPHCFNHYDACDPDTPYYRGQGWYRTSVPATIPANGKLTATATGNVTIQPGGSFVITVTATATASWSRAANAAAISSAS